MNADYGASTELAGPLQQRRALYQPRLPPCLQGATVRVEYGDATATIDPIGADAVAQAFPRTYGQRLVTFLAPEPDAGADKAVVQERPPIRVGVVFSGRQSPGGHNVVWGLHDALRAHNPHSVLYGFIAVSLARAFSSTSRDVIRFSTDISCLLCLRVVAKFLHEEGNFAMMHPATNLSVHCQHLLHRT